jgi:uncharacterized protein (DUF934 family)
MSKILRRRELVDDDWVTLGETPPGDTESVIVPFAKFRENREQWLARGGRLGVQLASADRVEDLAADLPRLSLVALEFPNAGDGRGYTAAKLLRQRYQFTGEIRAVGHVKQDQVYLMSRVGIDTFVLARTEKPEEAIETLTRFKVAYTPGAPLQGLTRERFHT